MISRKHKPHSGFRVRTPIERVWFWIDRFASEDSLKGRGNDECWEIEFRGSDLWNLRQAVESLEEQLESLERNRDYEREIARMNADTAERFRQQLETLTRIAWDDSKSPTLRFTEIRLVLRPSESDA